MKNKVFKNSLLVLINVITLTRLFGAIILPFIYYKYDVSTAALVTLLLFSTDAVDGFLARTLKLSTFFGAAMDALCDKLLSFTAFIILGIEYNIMLCPVVLEATLVLINYLTYRIGGNVQSSLLGKIKTLILDALVILSFVIMSLPIINIESEFKTTVINNTNKYITIFAIIIIVAQVVAFIGYNKIYNDAKKDPKVKHIKLQNRQKKNLKEALRDAFDHEYYLKHKDESIIKLVYK